MKDKGFKICLAIYIILLILDIISTLINYKIVPYLELNPLYHLGGMWLPILVNILYIVGFYLVYTKINNPTWRYVVIAYMVFIAYYRVFAIINNFHVYNSEIDIEVAKQVTQADRNSLLWASVKNMILPIIPPFMMYLFWSIDHKITKK